MSTADVLGRLTAALERVDQEALTTKQRLQDGEAVSGSAGLQRIHEIASDALANAEERHAA